MASRSRWPSWILLGGVPAFSLRERLMGGLRCFRSRAEPSPPHPPDQHRQPVAAPGRQIGPAHRSLLSLLPRHGASPSIEPPRVGPRRLREVTHPTADPLQRFLGGEMHLTYKQMVEAAFRPAYWQAQGRYRIAIDGGGALVQDAGGYLQEELNFSLFFGMAI